MSNRAAIHEAGHAAAWSLMGYRCDLVAIYATGGAWHGIGQGPTGGPDVQLLVAASGMAAELLLLGNHFYGEAPPRVLTGEPVPMEATEADVRELSAGCLPDAASIVHVLTGVRADVALETHRSPECRVLVDVAVSYAATLLSPHVEALRRLSADLASAGVIRGAAIATYFQEAPTLTRTHHLAATCDLLVHLTSNNGEARNEYAGPYV